MARPAHADVLKQLARNPGRFHEAREVAIQLEIPEPNVLMALAELIAAGKVEESRCEMANGTLIPVYGAIA